MRILFEIHTAVARVPVSGGGNGEVPDTKTFTKRRSMHEAEGRVVTDLGRLREIAQPLSGSGLVLTSGSDTDAQIVVLCWKRRESELRELAGQIVPGAQVEFEQVSVPA